ncbi:MAG: MtnX-like HAD-IB family phosphatase [Candidatus Zixiibacteriota bacterium]|nr:MAG: MtnX-like HAD-IB family phosphatase [candidate division Zixibacteria bacterium]
MNIKTLIFCDFDGTVAERDVGYHLFRHFSDGRNDELLPDWKAGRISSREILLREAEMVGAPAQDILDYLDRFDLDPGFADFVDLCEKNGSLPIIVSEGMDFYIQRLLRKQGLDHLSVLSNIGHLENNGIRIEFPYVNHSCTRCGSCKGERIAEIRAQCGGAVRTVFVGDGYSDACAAREADLLFAKKDLEKLCRERDIPYVGFSNFFEVADHLTNAGILKH